MPPAAPPSPHATPWHAFSPEEAFSRLEGTTEGLTPDAAAARLAETGPNALPVKPPPGLAAIFLHQFLSPLIYILLVAGIVSVLIGEMTDAGFIFAVILLNALLGTIQEWKAERSAAALQRLLQVRARVRRQGAEREVPAEELVPGDVVLLESGNRVPADLRLWEARGLAVDESLLTGESLAVAKSTETVAEDAPLGERFGMAFAGTTIAAGRGSGLVVATGSATQVGRIAREVSSAGGGKPPLVIRMERFARQISYLVLGFVLLLALVAHLKGTPWDEVFFMAVALAVSAIPEGLPVAMTVALSIATSRMARRSVIVRKLTAVEGLGSCTCVASDKTGTLTVNRQTVRRVWLAGGPEMTVSGDGYSGDGEIAAVHGDDLEGGDRERLLELAVAAIHGNEGVLEPAGDEWSHRGDAMDVALLALAFKLDLDPREVRGGVEAVGEIPYESELRYAARVYREGGEIRWALKGAVERVLGFCATMLTPQGAASLDREVVAEKEMELAAAGYRVLAIAAGPHPGEPPPDTPREEEIPPLTLLGLVGFIDPLREEVPEAIETCRRAGVRVVMVTGDHPATALTIARELGLAAEAQTMTTGQELAAAGPSDSPEFVRLVERAAVFARVSPLQKLQIVEALETGGHYVAVTGDGVNDAPALRRANIGVAMGSGTDVAKDTAEIIVTDDNFASLVAGIEEGRFAYGNVRKVIYLLISTGAAEIFLFTLALLAGLPIPLLAVQLLWLNLVTNGIQDVALAFEAGEPGVMKRPPRPPREGIFNRLMVEQTVVSGAVMGLAAFAAWWWMHDQGWPEAEARNATLLLMVLLENVHVFNCRSEQTSALRVPLSRNWILIGGVAAAQGIHILCMHLPLMQEVLGVSPVTPQRWLGLLLVALGLLAAMELFKRLRFGRRSWQTSA